ncbi:MAG: hypothetical protein ACLQU1_17865 [Bryobacteraceae bacterium]
MIIVSTCVIAIAVIAFVLGVRPKDVPAPEPESPFRHLDERKAAIYENLRDLQFEYRVGKLSDRDYQATKTDLQKELAAVLSEVDRVKATLTQAQPAGQPRPVSQPQPVEAARSVSQPSRDRHSPLASEGAVPSGFRCPHCGAKFDRALKFCGECGKPMKEATA